MHYTASDADLQALAASLDALIAFADQQEDFVLGAILDTARARFASRLSQPKT